MIHKIAMSVVFSVLVTFPALGANLVGGQDGNALYRVSQGVMWGCAMADVVSSYGKPELNPVLRGHNGTFGRRGIGIKLSLFGGYTTAQEIGQNRRRRRAWTILNFAIAAANCSVASYNYKRRN